MSLFLLSRRTRHQVLDVAYAAHVWVPGFPGAVRDVRTVIRAAHLRSQRRINAWAWSLDPCVAVGVMLNPRATEAQVNRFLDVDHKGVQSVLAQHPLASVDTLESLAASQWMEVRAHVARRRNPPVRVQERLALDPSQLVRNLLLANPTVADEWKAAAALLA